MVGLQETPRQKMIAMMYLVLTALLALNVSVEIIQAFVSVNNSMENTNENLKLKIDETYARFEQQNLMNEAKVGPFWTRAQEVRSLSNDLISYIEDIKWDVIARSEKITVDEAKVTPLSEIQSRDKYDVSTNYFFGGSQDGSKGKAGELRQKIEKFKTDVNRRMKTPCQCKTRMDTEGPYKDAMVRIELGAAQFLSRDSRRQRNFPQ